MKLLIAPTSLSVSIPVVLDIQESSGVTVKAALSGPELVEISILIGGHCGHTRPSPQTSRWQRCRAEKSIL